jgi:DNA-binding CsgD family transcriptional regulator
MGGLLLAALKTIEYQHFVRQYPGEVYGAFLAVIFTAVGIYFGLRWTKPKEIVREVPIRMGSPFVLNSAQLAELGITKREHEILQLIAEGLSNREIGERLFVSENTVKTHSSRLFDKMSVNRRVQAVQKARALGLIP